MSDRPAIDLFDAIHTTRAMRYLKPDPIPADVLREILDAAIRGPSGGNAQGWGWIVVADPDVKRQIADWYREGWQAAYGKNRDAELERAGTSGLGRANYLSAEHLANHLEDAPIWVMPVLRNAAPRPSARTGSSIYGAVQNLMLAARAYGIGSVLTTLYAGHEDDVKRLLGVPDDALTMALIPMGYLERGRFSEPQRRPVEEVAYWDHWGQPFAAGD